jgi:hypothetical protein
MASAGGAEVGRVSVRVVPNLDDFRSKVKKELEEVENMEAQVQISLDLEKFKAQIEEVKALLKSISDETVNVKIDRDGGVAKVEESLKGAASEAAKLGKGLKNALGDGDDTTRRMSKLSNVVESFGNFVQRAAGQAGQLAGQLGGQLADSARSFGSSLTQMIVQLVIWIPLLAAAAAGITFLVGAIAAGLGALPALIVGIGAPIAALVLGFDGVKAAAKQLSPELDHLKSTLSNTFEKSLTPVFKELKSIFPVLERGLNGVAVATSGFIGELVKVVTAKDNMKLLETALGNVKFFLDALAPGVKDFLTTLLKSSQASDIFKNIGGAVSDLLFQIDKFFNLAIQDGSLVKGVKNFRTLINDVGDLLSGLLTNSLKFFNAAEPGVSKFFNAIDSFFRKIDWDKLGKAFGDALTQVAEAIDQIPPQTIQDITDSFSELAKAIGDVFSGKSFDVLVAAFSVFIDIVTGVIHVIDFLLEGLAHLGDFIAGIPDWFGELFKKGGEIIDGLQQGAFEKWLEFLAWLDGIKEGVLTFFATAPEWLLTKGGEILSGLQQGAFTKWVEFTTWLAGIKDKVINFFAGAIGWLVGKGQDILNGLRNGAVTAFNNVVAFLGSIPKIIIGFFAGAGNWLVQAGKNILDGLWSGIKSAFGKIQSLLGNLTSLIPSWKGPAGVDKKLLFGPGQLIMQGLASGLKSGFDPVQSLLGDMTGTIADSFGVPLSAAMSVNGADIAATGLAQVAVAGTVDTNMQSSIAAALAGWTVELDANGIARLVNKANNVRARRG